MNIDNSSSNWQELLYYCAVSFIFSFFWLCRFIKASYKRTTLKLILINNFFRSLSAIAISVCTSLFLPETFNGITITPNIKLGIVIVTAIYGESILCSYLEKRFGFKTIDPMDKNDLLGLHEKLSETQRMKHAEQCAFKEEVKEVIKNQDLTNNKPSKLVNLEKLSEDKKN